MKPRQGARPWMARPFAHSHALHLAVSDGESLRGRLCTKRPEPGGCPARWVYSVSMTR